MRSPSSLRWRRPLPSMLPRPRPPQVVVLIFCGIVIGPAVLGLGDTHSIRLLANVGLGFLFLLAGYELDPALLRQHAGKLAIGGWLLSALLAIAAVGGLASAGFVRDYVPIGLALTTTALGTLLPILKDNDLLAGPFGRYVLAAGAAGELLPILVISLFLTRRGEFSAVASILAVLLRRVAAGGDPAGSRQGTAAGDGQAGPAHRHRADHAALVDRAAAGAARDRRRLRPGRGARRAGRGHRAAELESLDRHRPHAARARAGRGRLRAVHPDLLRVLGHGPGRGVDRRPIRCACWCSWRCCSSCAGCRRCSSTAGCCRCGSGWR